MELPLDLSTHSRLSASSDEDTPDIEDTGSEGSSFEDNLPANFNNIASSCSDVIDDVTRRHGDISVSLVDSKIWNAFSSKGTEMIINRNGRRMFPQVTISVSGLVPSGLYNIWLEITPADDKRYKYVCEEWTPVSQADPSPPAPPCLHPDSPNTGSFWMQKKITFGRLKLTNNRDSADGHILLQSMHRYKAKVHICPAGSDDKDDRVTLSFDETTFVAVTAYQNSSITQMKIHSNPFAKAFRDRHLNIRKLGNTRVSPKLNKEVNYGKSFHSHNRKRKYSDSEGSTGSNTTSHSLSVPTNELSSPFSMSTLPPFGPCDPRISSLTTSPLLYRPLPVPSHSMWSVPPMLFPPYLMNPSYPFTATTCSTTSSVPSYRFTDRCQPDQS